MQAVVVQAAPGGALMAGCCWPCGIVVVVVAVRGWEILTWHVLPLDNNAHVARCVLNWLPCGSCLVLLRAAGPLGAARGGAGAQLQQRAGAVHGAGQGQQAADLQQVGRCSCGRGRGRLAAAG